MDIDEKLRDELVDVLRKCIDSHSPIGEIETWLQHKLRLAELKGELESSRLIQAKVKALPTTNFLFWIHGNVVHLERQLAEEEALAAMNKFKPEPAPPHVCFEGMHWTDPQCYGMKAHLMREEELRDAILDLQREVKELKGGVPK